MQTQPLFISNATLLGYNQTTQYFGSDIGFKKSIELSIQCASSDISDVDGVSTGSVDLFSLMETKKDYAELFINNKPYGAAKITSFSFDEDDMVNSSLCNISFSTHQSCDDLTSLTAYYADYAASGLKGELLESFSDSIDLSRGENSTSYDRTIAISLNNSLNLENVKDLVRSYVKNILNFATFSFPDFSDWEGDIGDLISTTKKKFVTESIDELQLTFEFREALEAGNVVSDYSIVTSQEYSLTKNGIATVRETGTIEGLTSPRIDAAETGYAAELANSRLRMQNMFDYYNDGCTDLNKDSSSDIIFMEKGKTTDRFSGTIEYTVSSNNNPKFKNGEGEVWEYTVAVGDDGRYQNVVEEGTVTGVGQMYDKGGGINLEVYPRYQNAKTFFVATVLPSINGRIAAMISGLSPNPTSRKETHAPRNGIISYSRSFSNNPKYACNDEITGKSVDASSSVSHGISNKARFVALNPTSAKEIVQELNVNSLTSIQNNVRLLGYRINFDEEDTRIVAFGQKAHDQLSLLEIEDAIKYLSSVGYEFKGANDVIFTLNTTHKGGDEACP